MEIVVTGLISAIIGGVASFFALMKFSFISTLKDDNERLRERVSELEARINASEAKQKEAEEREGFYKNKLTLLETAHHDLPFPQWLKDINGVMLSLNHAYEKMFLIPIGKKTADYIGSTDFDIWPTEVAEKFIENDKKAKEKGGYWMGLEPIWIKDADISSYWRIAKYGRFVGNVCVGIAGIAIPVMDEDVVDRPSIEFVRHLIKQDRISKSLDVLDKGIKDADFQRKLSLIQSRYSRWKQSSGKMAPEKREIEKTNIVDSILALIEEI